MRTRRWHRATDLRKGLDFPVTAEGRGALIEGARGVRRAAPSLLGAYRRGSFRPCGRRRSADPVVEVGDPVALDDRRVRQLDGGVADVVEERTPSPSRTGTRLTRISSSSPAARHWRRDAAPVHPDQRSPASSRACATARLDALGDEGERRAGAGPAVRHVVGDDHDGLVQRVPAAQPSMRSKSASADDQGAGVVQGLAAGARRSPARCGRSSRLGGRRWRRRRCVPLEEVVEAGLRPGRRCSRPATCSPRCRSRAIRAPG